MGYRSDGAVYLSDEALFILPQDLRKDLQSWDKQTDNLYYFHGWKWYTGSFGYEVINQWVRFFDTLEDKGYDYDFIRLGEDDDDTEIRTSTHFYLDRAIGVFDASV